MQKNLSWLLGALCGVTLVVIVYLIKRLTSGKQADFDERQTAARGEAFKYAFFTTSFFELLYVCLEAGGISFADQTVGPLLPVLLGVAIFAITAIAKDAYLSLRENPKTTLVFLLLMIASNLLIGIPKFLDGKAFSDGRLTFDGVQLPVAALFLVVLAAFVIHWFRGRRSAEDGEGE